MSIFTPKTKDELLSDVTGFLPRIDTSQWGQLADALLGNNSQSIQFPQMQPAHQQVSFAPVGQPSHVAITQPQQTTGPFSPPVSPVTTIVPTEVLTGKKSGGGSSSRSSSGGGGGFNLQMPNFGPTPQYNQDVVPAIGQAPQWNENLNNYLNGTSLPMAIAPPTYQTFAQPVLGLGDFFSMTPETYNTALDTTKQNVQFNNQVMNQQYQDNLRALGFMHNLDQANQEQYSRTLQNRGEIIKGNLQQKQSAFMLSPQEEASMSTKAKTYLQEHEGNIQAKLAALHFKYQLALQDAKSKQDSNNLNKAFQQERMKTLFDFAKGRLEKAAEKMQVSDFQALSKAMQSGDQNSINALMNNIQFKDPATEAEIRAGIWGGKVLQQMWGIPTNYITDTLHPREETQRQQLFLQPDGSIGPGNPGGKK